jgi:peptidoglycan/xylan/chitin deacetylase (PgdA/CDA1 family)
MTFIAPHYHKAKPDTLFRFFRKDHFFRKTPWWLKKIYPGCVWDVYPKEKILYLSFDDGPHPVITAFVLEELIKFNAKATFFCIGKNVQRYPEIYQRLLDEGHAAGNHTQHHINGWKTGDEEYLHDIQKADNLIRSPLYRPPYGRIRKSQVRLMKQRFPNMKIIMWNVLAGDWIQDMTAEDCFKKVLSKISDGDIIVFHDSEKAMPRMQYALPRLLEYFTLKGYRFDKIPAGD